MLNYQRVFVFPMSMLQNPIPEGTAGEPVREKVTWMCSGASVEKEEKPRSSVIPRSCRGLRQSMVHFMGLPGLVNIQKTIEKGHRNS